MMGISTMAYTSLDTISPQAAELLDAARRKIYDEKHAYPPGRLEQYEIMLEKILDGAPGFELISIAATFSGPSK